MWLKLVARGQADKPPIVQPLMELNIATNIVLVKWLNNNSHGQTSPPFVTATYMLQKLPTLKDVCGGACKVEVGIVSHSTKSPENVLWWMGVRWRKIDGNFQFDQFDGLVEFNVQFDGPSYMIELFWATLLLQRIGIKSPCQNQHQSITQNSLTVPHQLAITQSP